MIRTVLVVDDSKVQCDHAVALCQEVFTDAHISMAYNGQEALAVLANEPADLVLIDLEMPVMDGIELISEMTRLQLGHTVMVMSSKEPKLISSVGVMAEAGGLNVLGCYQKPLSEAVLRDAMLQYRNDSIERSGAENQIAAITADEIANGIEQGQFSFHYQPKLTTRNIMLKGVEALARWQHPVRGFVSPLEFIGVAEANGLIAALTLHLVEQALQQKARWNQQGLRFSLALNLSPLMLADCHLVEVLETLLQQNGIQPREITLEVTENVMLGDVAKTLQTLTRLRLKDFGIALDDYGTGFANAEQLVRLPISELKLDRSLINGVARKSQLEKFLSSTIVLAQGLDLITVAEGVETLEDFQIVQKMGVHEVQGFFFSRPLPADQFGRWLLHDLVELRKQIMQAAKH